jgi:dolichol-phosphate mannosyltransferase
MGPVKTPLVVIPTYNESENIGSLVTTVLASDVRLQVLVVDDNSPDNTADEVLRVGQNNATPRVFLELRPRKLGLGSAYVHGLNWGLARGYDFLIQMDADGSHDPVYLATMLRLAEEYDFVVGSRYIPGGSTLNWGLGRRFLSRFGSFYARAVLGVDIADLTGGFNGWSAGVLRKIRLENARSDGYSFQIEMKYRAHKFGFKHVEFPIRFVDRRVGQSKMSASIAFEACWRVWEFRFSQGRTGSLPSR